MECSVTINLDKSFFNQKEKILVVNEGICASTFLFETGVHGLRTTNSFGSKDEK